MLETTIRDGGYEISHQFTADDVALVVSTLEAAGVSYIEVGHGMGVGSQRFPLATRPKERPVDGDLEHMRTARATARRAKVGVLFVAGERFCPIDYLDEVAAAGMDFVRLAFMPSDLVPANMRYVERAHELGMVVSINLMQSYVLSPRDLAKGAKLTRDAGADWFYVVDSAGGMQPAATREYVRAVLDATGMQVGLHAHNNLGMAVANSLAAIEAGATMVDGTLNGLGRATGNAPTEQLVLALQALGHEPEIDVEPIARLSAMYRVLFEAKGNDPMNYVSGASMLHSRNVPAVIAQAKERGLSVADFLVRVGREAQKAGCLDQFVFPPEVFEAAASGCKRAATREASRALVDSVAHGLAAPASLEHVCEDLVLRAARYHLPAVLHLVPADQFPFAAPLPWQSGALVGASVAWSGPVELAPDRRPDYVIADPALRDAALPACKQRALTCAWSDLEQASIAASVAAASQTGRKVVVARSGDPGPLGADDVVVVADRGPRARELADAVRRAGARAIAPAFATVIASRLQELIELSAQLGSAPDASAPWVDPLQAPGRDQAVVDLELAAIVEPGTGSRDELIANVAAARARTLAAGTGKP